MQPGINYWQQVLRDQIDSEKPVEETELIPGIIYKNTPSAKKSEPTEKTSELKLQPGINYWQQVPRDQIDSEEKCSTKRYEEACPKTESEIMNALLECIVQYSSADIVQAAVGNSNEEIDSIKKCQNSGGNFRLFLKKVELFVVDTEEGEEMRQFYHFQIVVRGQSFYAKVQANEIESQAWIQKATGATAYVYPEKNGMKNYRYYVHELISHAYEGVERMYSYPIPGWRKAEGEVFFVTSQGAIGARKVKAVCREKAELRFSETRSGKEAFFKMLQAMQCCNDQKISTVVILTTIAATLSTLFREANFPIHFLVALVGISNSGKTTLALTLSQIFNRPVTNPAVNFSATLCGLEVCQYRCGDSVCLVDDYKPETNAQKRKQQAEKLELITRAAGDGVRKIRMDDYSTSKVYYPPQGLVIVTGEQIEGVMSSRARTIVIRVEKGSVNFDNLQAIKQDFEALPTFFADFFGYIASRYGDVVNFIREEGPTRRNEGRFRTPRYNETEAIFRIIISILVDYGWKNQFFTREQARTCEERLFLNVHDVIMQNDHELMKADNRYLILAALNDAMVNRRILVQPKDMEHTSEYVILEDSEYFFVQTAVAYQCTKQFCNISGYQFTLITKDQVLDFLEDSGVLDIKFGKKKERARKLLGVKNNPRRYLYIDRQKMAEFLKKFDQR